jgi:hypothetical protein
VDAFGRAAADVGYRYTGTTVYVSVDPLGRE